MVLDHGVAARIVLTKYGFADAVVTIHLQAPDLDLAGDVSCLVVNGNFPDFKIQFAASGPAGLGNVPHLLDSHLNPGGFDRLTVQD